MRASRFRRFAATLVLAALLASVTPVLAAGWQSYFNERFGYEISYPGELFEIADAGQNGDGVTLVSPDGRARLIVFGGYNALGHDSDTMATELSRLDDIDEVTYRRVAKGWIVLSGYLDSPDPADPRIFYERVEFNPDRTAISGFRLEYPVSMRDEIDALIGPMGRSLTSPRPQ